MMVSSVFSLFKTDMISVFGMGFGLHLSSLCNYHPLNLSLAPQESHCNISHQIRNFHLFRIHFQINPSIISPSLSEEGKFPEANVIFQGANVRIIKKHTRFQQKKYDQI